MFATAGAVFFLHLGVQPVLSGSMRPAFGPGSLIVTRPIPTSAVHAGEVVMFRPPGETAAYAHRVVSVSGSAGHTIITTKGDANAAPDKWRAQLLGTHVPKVVWSVPWIGRAAVALHGSRLRVVVAVLAAIAMAVAVGQRLTAHRSHPVPTH
ncbi:MAG: signal peptidase I [Acidimicrobiales bacterium]